MGSFNHLLCDYGAEPDSAVQAAPCTASCNPWTPCSNAAPASTFPSPQLSTASTISAACFLPPQAMPATLHSPWQLNMATSKSSIAPRRGRRSQPLQSRRRPLPHHTLASGRRCRLEELVHLLVERGAKLDQKDILCTPHPPPGPNTPATQEIAQYLRDQESREGTRSTRYLMSGSHGTGCKSQLPPVIRAVKLSLRRRDQSIRSHPPPLEAADAHSIPRPSGPGVGASQGPVIVGAFIPHLQLVHNKVQIRERSHKRSREFRNRVSPHCRSIAVDGQRPIGRIKSSYTVRIPAAPRRRIAHCKILSSRPSLLSSAQWYQHSTKRRHSTPDSPRLARPGVRLLLPLRYQNFPCVAASFSPAS